ncbi:transporter substrate-binding domain-containing protein [Aminobacter sp. MSH1]|uniref:transporter substrate-binding domain-containing protein n=1 Tax=Aminobacter sp. MSH1 TaxID=374606 RepID=UPI00131F0B5F|nr:transporter substrate-binding domain-containing protein [Aminobacter sp. MSH1]
MRKKVLWLAVVTLASTIGLNHASAQTINELIGRGAVSIGVLTGVPPLTGTGSKGEDIGYHVDVANKIAEYLGVAAEIVAVTNSSRIAALESKRIDIQVAQSSATPERAKSVMFTIPYGGFSMVVFAPKETNLRSAADLKDKRISVARGGTQEAYLKKLNIPGLEVVPFEGDALATQALLSAQVDASASADILVTDIAKSKPDAHLEIKFPLYVQSYSVGVRKDAFELHQWLNNTIGYMQLNGELDEIHKKWVGFPLPKGLPNF